MQENKSRKAHVSAQSLFYMLETLSRNMPKILKQPFWPSVALEA